MEKANSKKFKLFSNILVKDISGAFEMKNNKLKQDDFNNEIVQKTWEYQKIYQFETKPEKGT